MQATLKSKRPRQAGLTTRAGLVTYQTRPLNLQRATSYGRCLQANRGVQGVQVLPCAKQQDRYRVYWLPAGAAVQARMFSAVQQVQLDRAIAEWGQYKWMFTQDGGADVITLADKKGVRDEYHVTETECSCENWQRRLVGTGVRCKHQVALLLALVVEGK